MEYEPLDTGVFNEDKYFDVLVEYAKAGPEDILVQINRLSRNVGKLQAFMAASLTFCKFSSFLLTLPAKFNNLLDR
jgi:hypothetical protein